MKIFLFFATILLSPIFYIWSGFVGSKLWEWFVIPNFPAAPKLGIAACIGLILLVKYATYGSADVQAAKLDAMQEKDDDEAAVDLLYSFFIGAFVPAFTLLSAWVITLFQ